MNPLHFFRWLFWTRAARRDARADIRVGDERITARLGPRPVWNPADNHEHHQVALDLSRHAEAQELRSDQHRVDAEQVRHESRWWLDARVGALFLLDLWSASFIAGSFGLVGAERFALGGGIVSALIFVTHRAAARSTESTKSGRSRLSATLLVYGIYAALVLAIAVVRFHASDDADDTSSTEIFAELCLAIVATATPAWFIESLWQRRKPTVQLAGERTNIRRRLRNAERAERRARAFRERLARAQAAWDASAARLRSQYVVAHQLARRDEEEVSREQPTTTNHRRPE